MRAKEGSRPRIVELIERFPKLSVTAGLSILLLSVAGLALVESDFTHRSFFHEDDRLLTTFEAFERRFGNDDAVLVAVHSPSGIFDADSIALLRELTERMWLLPDVIRVDSIINFPWVHAVDDDIVVEPFIGDEATPDRDFLRERQRIALSHDTLPGYLIDGDATTALVFGQVRPALDEPPDAAPITRAARELVRDLERGDHEFHLAGSPTMITSFAEVAESDNLRVIPVALLVCSLVLVVALRSVVSVLLSLFVIVAAAVTSIGVTGWLGIQINSITAALPQIIVAIAVADSVHVLSTFARARRRLGDPREAARYALAKNVKPTIITTVTTAVGFLSFAASPIEPIAGLGLAAAAATGVAWLYTYLIVGGLLFLVPFRTFRPGEDVASRSESGERIGVFFRRWGRVLLVGFSAATLAGLVLSTRIRVDADPVKYFDASHPLRVAYEFVSETVGATRTVELVVDSGRPEGAKDPAFLAKVDALELWIESLPKVTRAVSIVDSLKETHRALHGDDPEKYLLSDDGDTLAQELLLYTMSLPEAMNEQNRITLGRDALHITVLWTEGSSTEAVAAMNRMEDKGRELGLSVVATGKYQLFQRIEGYVVESFLSSVGIALFLVTGLLMVTFRSVRLGALALVPNVVPLLMGGALLWLLGETLNIGTVLVVSVCLGIAVDDTVHSISEYRRLVRSGFTEVAAVSELFHTTVPSLVTTSAALAMTYGAFLLSTFTPYQIFGLMTASIMTMALAADIGLLPVLLLRSARVAAPAVDTTAGPLGLAPSPDP